MSNDIGPISPSSNVHIICGDSSTKCEVIYDNIEGPRAYEFYLDDIKHCLKTRQNKLYIRGYKIVDVVSVYEGTKINYNITIEKR